MPIAHANSIDIWYDTFGEKQGTPILLIAGGCCQGIFWPEEFCEKLASQGFYVVRYDHRDTGLSSHFDYAHQAYDIHDMAEDARGLLDVLNIRKTHIIGLSLGGPIAELLAVKYPDRIHAIMLISTSGDFEPMNRAYAGLSAIQNTLSPPREVYLNWMKKFMHHAPTTEDEHVQFRVAGWRILNGTQIKFEEKLYVELHREFLRRSHGSVSYLNHVQACKNSEKLVKSLPAQVRVPTVILHGSEDVILPLDHGQMLAESIKHARYIPVSGMGHVLNRHFYDLIIKNVHQNA